MSISSQINRIKAAKNAIISSINGKGVTVPTSVNIDDLSGYIDNIQTGGSSSVNIETVTAKPSSTSTTFNISGLKGQPKFFALAYSANLTAASTRYVISANWNGTQSHVTYAYKSGSNGYIYQSTSYLSVSYSNGTLTLKTSSTTNGGSFYNGNYRLVYAY